VLYQHALFAVRRWASRSRFCSRWHGDVDGTPDCCAQPIGRSPGPLGDTLDNLRAAGGLLRRPAALRRQRLARAAHRTPLTGNAPCSRSPSPTRPPPPPAPGRPSPGNRSPPTPSRTASFARNNQRDRRSRSALPRASGVWSPRQGWRCESVRALAGPMTGAATGETSPAGDDVPVFYSRSSGFRSLVSPEMISTSPACS
jgi:hypothetical protein